MRGLGVCAVLAIAACHGAAPGARVDGTPAPVVDAVSNVLDERVPIPNPDPDILDVIGPDEIVQPGETKMFCAHFENTGAELAIDNFQGSRARSATTSICS